MNPEVLEKYRIKKGLTQRELCSMLHRTEGWYTHIKNGEYPLPSKYVAPLANVFGVNPERLAKELFAANKLDEMASSQETSQP